MTDLVHLLGRDIVDFDDEDGLIFLQQALELVEVAALVLAAPHIFLFMKAGCLRATVRFEMWFGGWIWTVAMD